MIEPVTQAELDDQAVDAFAIALKDKLSQARAMGKSGWADPLWPPAQITANMMEHVYKGDPRDVAAYCMFLHARGEAIQVVGDQASLFATTIIQIILREVSALGYMVSAMDDPMFLTEVVRMSDRGQAGQLAAYMALYGVVKRAFPNEAKIAMGVYK